MSTYWPTEHPFRGTTIFTISAVGSSANTKSTGAGPLGRELGDGDGTLGTGFWTGLGLGTGLELGLGTGLWTGLGCGTGEVVTVFLTQR